jgi:uncharacterized protein (TIGR02145 family)
LALIVSNETKRQANILKNIIQKKMKKITLLILLIFAIAETQAQNYQITFTGTGASNTFDSIKVENLTQGTEISLSGGDILNLILPSGINEFNNDLNTSLKVYPNPTSGECLFSFEAIENDIATIELYEIKGKRSLQMSELLIKGKHTYSINGINSGIYILKIESAKYNYSAKLISYNKGNEMVEIQHIETLEGLNNHNKNSLTPKIKGGKETIDMQYVAGDLLKVTGKSGPYSTVFMFLPTQSQTLAFNFIACTDASNNNYPIVLIDTMIWMAENLKTTKYQNGDSITNVSDAATWVTYSTGAYRDYYDSATIKAYGKLYNGYTAVDARNVCPIGWHVPSESEFTTLINYLGGENTAGGKMKETGLAHWTSPNLYASNLSGFTALGGGYINNNTGLLSDIGNYGSFWTSTSDGATNQWMRALYFVNADALSYTINKKMGYNIRCLKD